MVNLPVVIASSQVFGDSLGLRAAYNDPKILRRKNMRQFIRRIIAIIGDTLEYILNMVANNTVRRSIKPHYRMQLEKGIVQQYVIS